MLTVFLSSGRGGKTLEKHETLNYTNTQCKALIQSVWTANAAWKFLILCPPGASLPWFAIIWSNAADNMHA